MINIKFKKATMHNFLCFDHAEVLLDSLGYTIVSGKNNRTIDNAISNGSGKSSVFNAISFALTGETIQGLSKNLENIYADPNDCWVELEFNINDDQFVIKRVKTPKQELKIYINGIDKSGKGIKESNQILAKYVPDLTSMLLGSVIILGQGLPCKFTEGHPGLRKEKLEKLTKSDYMIQSVRTKLDDRKLELAGQLRAHEDSKVSLNTQLSIYQDQLKVAKADLKEFDKYARNGSLNDFLNVLDTDIKQLSSDCTNIKEQLNREKDSLQVLDESYNQAKVDLQSSLREALIEPKKAVELANNEYIAWKAELTTEINRLMKLDAVTDICPTCGQKLLNVTKIDTSAAWEETRVKSLAITEKQKEITSLRANIKEIESQYTEKQKSADADYLADKKQKNDTLKKLDSDLKQLTKEQQQQLQEQVRLKTLADNYNKLISAKDELEVNIAKLKKELKNIESSIVVDNEHIQVITNLISLAKREFRGILLENVINYINQRVGFYSKEVFDSDALSFSLNENYIDIIYDNKYYEALSGGEKQKVDIIIQLALRDLLSSQLGITSNILVIDEIFDFLDAKGCQKILSVITNLSNIESVFIISHHINDLSISYDSKLIVEKGEDGISHITAH